MGGVGVATRNKRFLNSLNPAAVTARDTLSFMMDVGLYSENKVFTQKDISTANNVLNINNINLSFPVYKSLALQIGLQPFSSVGYDYENKITDPAIIYNTGAVTYTSQGKGNLYQFSAGGGFNVLPGLSAGAEMHYYFGGIEKESAMTFTSTKYRSLSSGYLLSVHGLGGKFGLQYERPVGKDMTLTLGATYRTGTDLKGSVTDYKYATISSVSDTLRHNVLDIAKSGVKIASEIAAGVSLRRGDAWSAEVNYIMSDWSGNGMDSTTGFANVGSSTFSTTKYQSVRAGLEFVPNRNDIRYYLRRCSYRVGTYYNQSYYRLDGNTVNSFGLTLGMTLPVFRWYNGLSIAVDLGQRGSTSGNMTRERYANFVIGFNIHDIWFQKARYD